MASYVTKVLNPLCLSSPNWKKGIRIAFIAQDCNIENEKLCEKCLTPECLTDGNYYNSDKLLWLKLHF
jgi:hypothetical protein